ncbi:hypothetical protein HYX16_01490 [Candidatus Woesearchaeota archaeon]|nr:hypothetical protein [Candidatus Woesearchaeota archaeon]
MTEEKDKRLVLLEYLKGLNLRDPKLLESKSAEILEKTESCLSKYLSLPADNSRRNYYTSPVKLIKDAIKKRDFKDELPGALEFLIDSLSCEIF